jgi:hypothetical protein
MITAHGLRAVRSELPKPGIELRSYWQDIDRAWLWLTAEAGTFDPVDGFYSPRQMRAADRAREAADWSALSPAIRAKAAEASFAITVAEGGERAARLLYPDLALVVPREESPFTCRAPPSASGGSRPSSRPTSASRTSP